MSDLTVREYASVWLEDVRGRAHPATVVTYERIYRLYIGPSIGERPLAGIVRPDLKALVSRHAGRGLQPAMLLRVLSNLFSAAFDEGKIATQPAQRLWKHARKRANTSDVKAFTPDELGMFLDASRAEPCYGNLFHAMAFTGMRAGEARALTPSDVHEASLKLDVVRTFSGNVLGPTTKTRAARRIEIPAELGELLGRLARESSGQWLFHREGASLNQRAVSEAFRRVLKRAGLPLHHGTHSLRHTYASNLIQQGCQIDYVQAQLGHQSIQQTVDVYGRWLTLSRASELERFVAGTKFRGGKPRRLRFPKPLSGTSCSSTPDDGEGIA